MTLTDTVLQFVSWFLAVLQFALAAYILFINRWGTTNRLFSGLIFLLAVNNFAVSQIIGAIDATTAALPAFILAAVSPLIQPTTFLLSVVLLKPEWLEGRHRWIWWPVYGLIILPPLLTTIDVLFDTQLWYTGLGSSYTGGYISIFDYAHGQLAPILRVLLFYIASIPPIVFPLYVALFDKKTTRSNRRSAWLLAAAFVIAMVVQMGLRDVLSSTVRVIAVAALLAVAYGYTGFEKLVAEQRAQRGKLQPRLTGLILATTLPILIAVLLFANARASEALILEASGRLEVTTHSLKTNMEAWLNFNLKALESLVRLPEVASMQAFRQRPALQTMDATYDHIYLVSTTDLDGINVARSDDDAPKDYSDRFWFQEIRDGAQVAFQTLVGRTSGVPALVVSVPIRNTRGETVGVGMFASDLTNVAEQVRPIEIGSTGYSYVIDTDNLIVLHSDPAYYEDLRDLSTYPPVQALRRGELGLVQFTDEAGNDWWAHVDVLENGWGVIVQQRTDELLASQRLYQGLSWTALGIGAVMLAFFASITTRQAVAPIVRLTETAAAIADGDLSRTAPVVSEDEVGVLAHAFNDMTARLRQGIGELEQRVDQRTQDLEHQTERLLAAAQIARDTTAERELGAMLERAVESIHAAFGFYHVGIFLIDEAQEYAILEAATGEVGLDLVRRGHRLKVGQSGLVGYVTLTGQPRLARDVAADALYFRNPLLPRTRSEMVLPLQVGRQIIGAIDFQSEQEAAFDERDLAVLQTMADQLAVAIENARLLERTQRAVRELETAYGKYTLDAWRMMQHATDKPLGYRYRGMGVEPLNVYPQETRAPGKDGSFAVPIKFRDQVIGLLKLRSATGDVSPETLELVEEISGRLGIAMENARLLEATRQQAVREQTLSRITASIRAESEIDLILERALEELGRVLDVERAVAHIDPTQKGE
ncbi:MAG: GAF domain-containing protein [Anaerolineae bacterium]|nr:GAF domain-containing protein [Anaerolineae bacterium]